MNGIENKHLDLLKNNLLIIEEEPKERKLNFREEMDFRVKLSLNSPIPETEDSDWDIPYFSVAKKRRTLFRTIKNKLFFTDYDIADLREEVIITPLKTLPKINELIKKYPADPELYVLSAICSAEFIFGYPNLEKIISSMKGVIITEGTGLVNGALNIYNLNSFIKHYYFFLERLKREQEKVQNILRPNPSKLEIRRKIDRSQREVSLLLQNKNKIINDLNILACRQSGSFYYNNIKVDDIAEACRLFAEGKINHEFKGTTVVNYLKLIQRIGGIISHIPMLKPLFNDLLRHFPEDSRTLSISRNSLTLVSDLLNLKIAGVRKERKKVRKLCKKIFNFNLNPALMRERKNAVYYQSVAIQVAYDFLDSKARSSMIKRTLTSLEYLVELNKDPENKYGQILREHIRKLEYLQLKSTL